MLACAAAGVTGLSGCGGNATPPAAPPLVPASPAATEALRSARRRSPVKEPLPVNLAIPVLGLDTPLLRLGLNEDGTVEVPTAPQRAGWFRLGPVPGRRGSSVILGHVDSVDGPAVFAGLSTMRRPDIVQVALEDDTIVSFEVTGIETFANADFPAERVYAGTMRAAELNLVTCGGDYDRERGGYQSNVVVFTRRTGISPSRRIR